MTRTVDRIIVPFHGVASGVEDLTWGQREIYTAMVTQQSWLPLVTMRAVRPGTTISDVVAELRYSLNRYDSLRTRLVFGPDGEPRQAVAGEGEIALEVLEAGDADPVEVGIEIGERYRDSEYDFARDWPVRTALVLQHGTPSQLVTVFCHLVMDASARAILLSDLAARELSAHPSSDSISDPAAGAAMLPVELARWERGEEALATSAASLRSWERFLRAIPARRFPPSHDPRRPRYWEAVFQSRALHLALRAISPRAAGATAPLLAVYALALHRVTGADPVVAQIVVSNRFRSHLTDVFAPVNQTGLFVIDVGDSTCADVLRRSRGRAMSAYKNAYYDPRERAQLVARVARERGEDLDIACFFNDRRMAPTPGAHEPAPTEVDIRAALADTSFAWRTRTDQPSERLFLHVEDVADVVCLTAWTDTHQLAPATLEAVLRETEAVAVSAALDLAGP